MKTRGAAGRRTLACLVALSCHSPGALFAQSESQEARISPIAMTANVPGLEITARDFDRLVTLTELNPKQLEELGVRQGKLDEKEIAKIFAATDDSRIRSFIEFFDQAVAKASDRSQARLWKLIAGLDPFIRDAVKYGRFDDKIERDLRKALNDAATDGDTPELLQARVGAFRLLSDARLGAVKTARGYRTLAELLKRELEGRELVRNIGLVVELRTSVKQPTLSPRSFVTMDCGQAGSGFQKLEFNQRRSICNEYGVCRIESVAEISKGDAYRTVFDKLQSNGRSYLDGCSIGTTMLVDGAEITRQLPGKFTSHTVPMLK